MYEIILYSILTEAWQFMFDMFHTIFKFREKESPDVLGMYPERAHIEAMPERRYLWSSRILVILAIMSMSITMILALTLYLMLPQKTVYPRLLQINKYFSELEQIQPAELNIGVTDLIAEQHITDYIILRNTISNDYDELISRWGRNEVVYWYSGPNVFNKFYENDVRFNVMQFRKNALQRFVKIEWVRPLTMGLWQAQFLTMDSTPNSDKVMTKIWRATLRIEYMTLPFRNKDDAMKNPFGFVVTNYSLGYDGTPETSPHYLERAKQLAESRG